MAVEETPVVDPRVLVIENLNNKLVAPRFLHVAPMPPSGTLNGVVNTEWPARTPDDSFTPFLIRIVDAFKVFLDQVPTSVTWQAYGMSSVDFVKHYKALHGVKQEQVGVTAVAVYFIEKIS